MKTKINLKILGTVIAFLLCFPLHFIYEKVPFFITSIIAPVNESIFEHMKMLFTSIIFAGVIQKIIVKVKKLDINNICFSNFVAATLSIPIFLSMFIPIYLYLGENLPITIFIMLLAIIVAEYISYLIMNMKDLKMENITIIFTIIVYLIFGVLTYNPPINELFRDPITNRYSI